MAKSPMGKEFAQRRFCSAWQNVQIYPGLLRAAMAHQRSNDGKIDASIHQMSKQNYDAASGA